jgi:hypothetical protein
MVSSSQRRLLRLLCRIYGLMMLAYPSKFRREYSREMALVFSNRARDVVQNKGSWALLPFSLHIIWDWLTTTLHETEIMRKALTVGVTGISSISLAASGFLALSYVAFKGPNDLRPLTGLILFVALSALTLVVLAANISLMWTDLLFLAGAAGLVWLGWSMVERTLSGPHFEGYALVMGGVGIFQGALTLVLFLWRLSKGWSTAVVG